jgi:hypothetical protein
MMVVKTFFERFVGGGRGKFKIKEIYVFYPFFPNLQGTEDEVIHWSHGQKLHSVCANPSGKIISRLFSYR